MANQALATFIQFLHLALILFIFCALFSDDPTVLLLDIVVCAAIMFHWATNDNTCCLTMAEHYIRYGTLPSKHDRGDSKHPSFTAQLINPVFDFSERHQELSILSYGALTAVLVLACWKILHMRCNEAKQSLGQIIVVVE